MASFERRKSRTPEAETRSGAGARRVAGPVVTAASGPCVAVVTWRVQMLQPSARREAQKSQTLPATTQADGSSSSVPAGGDGTGAPNPSLAAAVDSPTTTDTSDLAPGAGDVSFTAPPLTDATPGS